MRSMPARLQHPDGDRDVVERAEAFAVIRKRVMQPAAEMTRRRSESRSRGIPVCISRRSRSSAAWMVPPTISRKPSTISADHGSSSCATSSARQRAVAHLRRDTRRCGPARARPSSQARLDDVGGLDHAGLEAGGREPDGIFGGKNVRPDIDVIPGRVDDVSDSDIVESGRRRAAGLADRSRRWLASGAS